MTIFLGCGFAAKYREGGGNFSVPLQWMLGLRRLNLDAVWLEVLPTSGDPGVDQGRIDNFQRQMRAHGLGGRYCLLLKKSTEDLLDLADVKCIGLSKKALQERLAGPNVLLNLSYSVHPPFLMEFERRVFCDLDPSEIFYWMTKMELGQSSHHEFWTIGLNVHAKNCRLPETGVKWRTFYPLVDTKLIRRRPAPRGSTFTTVGQWYWNGAVEVDGEFPDLSKKVAFEPYVDLPDRVPAVRFELAMNINPEDPERARLRKHGWHVVDPHRVARTPGVYRRYLASARGEFTAIKGVDVSWKTGWLSDRAAAFLAMGRPVVTEDSGAARYLPRESGFQFIHDLQEAADAIEAIQADWRRWSKMARSCAMEVFDSVRNLKTILDL